MEYGLPRGIQAARYAIVKALVDTKEPGAIEEFVRRRWGPNSALMKAAVAGGGTGSGEWGAELVGDAGMVEFVEAVDQQTIIGRLQGIRNVPANVPLTAMESGTVAWWASESKAPPLSRSSLTARTSFRPLKLAAMIVSSLELLQDSSPKAEALLRNDMIRAAREFSDNAFIDKTNAGVAGKTPPAVTYNAPQVAATGIIGDDVEAAMGSFGGSLLTASWVMSPRTAASIGVRGGGKGLGADLGARGGMLAGLPVICSESVDCDSDGSGDIALIDAAGIAIVDEGAEINATDEGSIEMLDNPTGASDTPVAATSLVSLWQAEAKAIIVTRRISWTRQRAGSVIVLTGANYSGT